MTPLLVVNNLSKRFGGLTAAKDVSFDVQPGEITGILGPNGAGKTTLFNLLTGFIGADGGAVEFAGHSLIGLAPHRIVNLGLARTFQLCRPFVGMTVLENVIVACLGPRVRAERGRELRASRILDQVGLSAKAGTVVDVLPYGDLRRIEIARALATKPKLLLLDEPFAGLGVSEIEPLAALIRKLHAEEGLTLLIVEHKLRELMKLVTRVIAMDFGEIIAEGPPGEIVRNPRVVEAYIGHTEGLHGVA